jgi:hypothetical protein
MPFVRGISPDEARGMTLDTLPAHAHICTRGEIPNYNPNDTLAKIIVEAWRDPEFRTRLLTDAEPELRERGMFFVNPRVITPQDYDQRGFAEGEAVFVLPDKPRDLPRDADLLDSARAAMAYTPVGI